jgi:hypothetical protein
MIDSAGRIKYQISARTLKGIFIIYATKLYLRYDARKVSTIHYFQRNRLILVGCLFVNSRQDVWAKYPRFNATV